MAIDKWHDVEYGLSAQETALQMVTRGVWELNHFKNGQLEPGYKVKSRVEFGGGVVSGNLLHRSEVRFFYLNGKELNEGQFFRAAKSDIDELRKIFQSARSFIDAQVKAVGDLSKKLRQAKPSAYQFDALKSDVMSFKSRIRPPYATTFKNTHDFLGGYNKPDFVNDNDQFIRYPSFKDGAGKYHVLTDDKPVTYNVSEKDVTAVVGFIRDLDKLITELKHYYEKELHDVPIIDMKMPAIKEHLGEVKADDVLMEILHRCSNDVMVRQWTDLLVNLHYRLTKFRIALISFLRQSVDY